MTTGPYSHAAWDYWRAGWRGILPLPQGQKWPPPLGFTGADGAWVGGADIQAWIDGPEGAGNIALRLPTNIIGLDVDDYDGKEGVHRLKELKAQYGELPDGPVSGARETGGIHYFRVPDGLRWPGNLGDAIEIVQTRHRYAVVWPSFHPSGAQYRWNTGVIPHPGDIPELPESWVIGITGGQLAQEIVKAEVLEGEVDNWLLLQGKDDPCAAVERVATGVRDKLETRKGSRHDAMTRAVMRLVHMATEGHRGVPKALEWLKGVWTRVSCQPPAARDLPASGAEWSRALEGAVAVALAARVRGLPVDPCQDPLSGILPPRTVAEALSADALVLAHPEPGPGPHGDAEGIPHRHVLLRSAADIEPRKAWWLWDGRIALGTLALLAGREGLGKSTLGLWVAAAVTRGELPGCYRGQPRAVLISATEDSWSHTLVPRLIAAQADLTKIYQVRVEDAEGLEQSLMLPVDLNQVERAALEVNSAMWVMDPLMSRLEGSLDTHRDGDVRRALEPLIALAERTAMGLLGLIHFNKSAGNDPTNAIMGSRAFTAVARSVLTVIPHTGDENERQRVLGLAKNNLGPDNLPLELFEIVGREIDTREGPTGTGALEWRGVMDGSISEAMQASAGDPEDRSSTREAADWLRDYLADQGGEAGRAEIWKAARNEGISESTLKRARVLARVESVSLKGIFPRRSVWRFRDAGSSRARGGPLSHELTGLIPGHSVGPTLDDLGPVGPVGPVGQAPPRANPLGRTDCGCPNRRHGVHADGCNES